MIWILIWLGVILIMDQFSVTLRRLMAERRISHKEICAALNIKQSTFSKWYNGVNEPPLSVVVGIAQFLGASLDHLLTGKDMPPVNHNHIDPEVMQLIYDEQISGEQLVQAIEHIRLRKRYLLYDKLFLDLSAIVIDLRERQRAGNLEQLING